MDIDRQAFDETLANITERLLEARIDGIFWEGSLSSSALSTATAVFALSMVDPEKHQSLIRRGLDWLRDNQNEDGGFGDTVLSGSNISTTLLCWSAFAIAAETEFYAGSVAKTERWLRNYADGLEIDNLVNAVEKRYGDDKTFSVPILTMCALAGRLGDKRKQAWIPIKALPFELAALPHRLFKWLRLNVVSYALPALIAIGQVNYHFKRPLNPLTRLVRRLTKGPTLKLLERIQPTNGGFLEAIPLTSFVVMSLSESNLRDHPVVIAGVKFLTESVRMNGSWPIDTNLSTWLTTLSINALASGGGLEDIIPFRSRANIRQWLLAQQFRTKQPYTQSAPGAWSWTNLPGAVPDADDTAGALISLYHLNREDERVIEAASKAIKWLMNLQNSDGGIPTFCKGWGKLPFDRSAPDLTAHALAGWGMWINQFRSFRQKRIGKAMEKAVAFLVRQQRKDGTWLPLWFGNQHVNTEQNPLYGTARVISNLCTMPDEFINPCLPMLDKAALWVLDAQNNDGSWGGGKKTEPSLEETSLALDAMASLLEHTRQRRKTTPSIERIEQAISMGIDWICEYTDKGLNTPPCPIGLYFAKLWYFEELYPLIFAQGALLKTRRICGV